MKIEDAKIVLPAMEYLLYFSPLALPACRQTGCAFLSLLKPGRKLQHNKQKNIFPLSFVNPINEIAVECHAIVFDL
jgi:hypothetical protein